MQGNSHRFPGAGLGGPLFCLPDRLALLWKSWSLRFCDWPSGMQRVSGRAGTPAQGCRAPKLSEAKGMRLATVGTAQSPSAPGAGTGRRRAHFCLGSQVRRPGLWVPSLFHLLGDQRHWANSVHCLQLPCFQGAGEAGTADLHVPVSVDSQRP